MSCCERPNLGKVFSIFSEKFIGSMMIQADRNFAQVYVVSHVNLFDSVNCWHESQCGRMARWSNMSFFWHLYYIKTLILIINKAF